MRTVTEELVSSIVSQDICEHPEVHIGLLMSHTAEEEDIHSSPPTRSDYGCTCTGARVHWPHERHIYATLTFTPTYNLEWTINLNMLLEVGGRLSTRREPPQTLGRACTHNDPRLGIEPGTFLLWDYMCWSPFPCVEEGNVQSWNPLQHTEEFLSPCAISLSCVFSTWNFLSMFFTETYWAFIQFIAAVHLHSAAF